MTWTPGRLTSILFGGWGPPTRMTFRRCPSATMTELTDDLLLCCVCEDGELHNAFVVSEAVIREEAGIALDSPLFGMLARQLFAMAPSVVFVAARNGPAPIALAEEELAALAETCRDGTPLPEGPLKDKLLSACAQNGLGRESPPATAIRIGSFTAWATPLETRYFANIGHEPLPRRSDAPRAGQPYCITIQVAIPDDLESYPLSDLAGSITGAHELTIPAGSYVIGDDGRVAPATDEVRVRNGVVQVMYYLPGTRVAEGDRIEISSQILDETASFELDYPQSGSGEAIPPP